MTKAWVKVELRVSYTVDRDWSGKGREVRMERGMGQ